MITPAQIRAARALLGWKQTDLAKAADVSEISVKNIERGATDARGSTLAKIHPEGQSEPQGRPRRAVQVSNRGSATPSRGGRL
jgi:predicted transcriptional regulator